MSIEHESGSGTTRVEDGRQVRSTRLELVEARLEATSPEKTCENLGHGSFVPRGISAWSAHQLTQQIQGLRVVDPRQHLFVR
jgi:hypothetical protein